MSRRVKPQSDKIGEIWGEPLDPEYPALPALTLTINVSGTSRLQQLQLPVEMGRLKLLYVGFILGIVLDTESQLMFTSGVAVAGLIRRHMTSMKGRGSNRAINY